VIDDLKTDFAHLFAKSDAEGDIGQDVGLDEPDPTATNSQALTPEDQAALADHYNQQAAQHANDAAVHASAGRPAEATASAKNALAAQAKAKRFAKHDFTTQQRDDAAKSGAAMPDGSFPIKTAGDLHNAMQAIGRAKNPDAVKAHIRARAKALGLEGSLSDAFKKSGEAGNHGDDSMALDDKQAAELQKALAKAQRLAEFTDAEKAFLKSLPEAERDGFIDLDQSARTAKVAKSAEADSVVYTSKSTGVAYRKSADPATIALAKSNDDLSEKFAKSEALREDGVFAKRAGDELKHVSATEAEKVVFLKSMDGRIVPNAEQMASNAKILKAMQGAAEVAKGFERAGVMGESATPGASKADAGIAEIRKSNPKLSKEQAAATFWKSDLGREIRAEMDAARRPVVA
jgi:hypothetical protein